MLFVVSLSLLTRLFKLSKHRSPHDHSVNPVHSCGRSNSLVVNFPSSTAPDVYPRLHCARCLHALSFTNITSLTQLRSAVTSAFLFFTFSSSPEFLSLSLTITLRPCLSDLRDPCRALQDETDFLVPWTSQTQFHGAPSSCIKKY